MASSAQLCWQLRGLMDDIGPEDLTRDELRSLIAVLAPARQRVWDIEAKKLVHLSLVRSGVGDGR
jgi:hypothetical protein